MEAKIMEFKIKNIFLKNTTALDLIQFKYNFLHERVI